MANSGYFCGRMMQGSALQTYTLPAVLYRLERGTLGCRWGVCWRIVPLGGAFDGTFWG